MPILDTVKGTQVTAKLWLPAHEVEPGALDKIRTIASIPGAVDVAIMPDCHDERGSCVGAVIAIKGAIAPSFVGVDIGCGMSATLTNLTASDLPNSLQDVRLRIERDVPVGFNQHKDPQVGPDKSIWATFHDLTPKIHSLLGKAQAQMGTLGGGNHFIELCLDDNDRVWLMLHTGSRHIGKEIADIYIDAAGGEYGLLREGTPAFDMYWRALEWAQYYAALNRETIARLVIGGLKEFFPQLKAQPSFSCHHNYAKKELLNGVETIVTRKGAIEAGYGQVGIIPGSMGEKSYIVRGLGNPESMCSASHGAGRKMSRSKAKKLFTAVDIEAQLGGVECRRDDGILDELPGAYKDIDAVMSYQSDLVEPIFQLKQVLCVKG